MNGIHDLGGMHGLGPIPTEENEPYFHHEWERRVFPLFASLFVGGHFNVDEFRHAIEGMAPTEYLQSSYYEHWLHAFETLLLSKGVISVEELWRGAKPTPCRPGTPVLTQDMVSMVVSTGGSARVSHDVTPRFRQWTAAMENMVTALNLAVPDDISRRTQEWRQAYLNTPHGQPIVLANASCPPAHSHHHLSPGVPVTVSPALVSNSKIDNGVTP